VAEAVAVGGLGWLAIRADRRFVRPDWPRRGGWRENMSPEHAG
jgi:hypothetical protein